MPQINLLPWREQRRAQQKRLFILFMIISIIGSIFIIFIAYCYEAKQIENQITRNKLLEQEIIIIERQLTQIKELELKKDQYISRIIAIRNLHISRELIVHLFDELIHVVASGITLSLLEGKKGTISLTGYTKSNSSVYQMMKLIEINDWLHKPVLAEIKNEDNDSSLNQVDKNQFKLIFILKPKDRSEVLKG